MSTFNIGIVIGPWLGGLALAGTDHPTAVGWVGAALEVLGLITVAPAAWLDAKARRATGRGRAPLPREQSVAQP